MTTSQHDLLISGARIVDGTGAPRTGPCDVLVSGGRIMEISPAGSTAAARAATGPLSPEILDARGRTLLPGLFDVHVHATTDPARGAHELLTMHPSEKVLSAVPALRSTLHGGVTSARDLSGADGGTRAAIEAGWVEGPRLQVALRILSITGGHGDWRSIGGTDLTGGSGGGRVADGPADFITAVREVAREGGDWIKVAASGGFGSPRSDPDHGGLRPEELAAVVDEAGRHPLVGVAAHAQGTRAIADAVAAGVRSIEHGYLIDDPTIEAMLARGTWLVPTLTTLLRPRPASDAARPERAERLARLREAARERIAAAIGAGVRIATGTDAGIVAHGGVLSEMAHLSDLGMDPLSAIHAATGSAAELCGVADDRGTVRPGLRADLLLCTADPLADLGALRRSDLQVLKGGVPVPTTATTYR